MVSVQQLMQLAFFRHLPEHLMRQFADSASECIFEQGEIILHQHDEAQYLFLLLDGVVQFLIHLQGFNDLFVGSTGEQGALLGWSILRPPYRYTSSVRCEERARFIRLPRNAIEQILRNESRFGLMLTRRVAAELVRRLEQARNLKIRQVSPKTYPSAGARIYPESIIERLRVSPFFESFPEKDLVTLAAHANIISLGAGQTIFRQDALGDKIYMLAVGKVQLSFEAVQREMELEIFAKRRIHIHTISEPGGVIGWSAIVEPYRYRDTATAIEDSQLIAFDREWLEEQAEMSPEFGLNLISRILWILGNRLRETRIGLVVKRYEKEALAIRTLLNQSQTRLSIDSPLHKLPSYLENRLTLGDAFQTLELLRVHGEPLEAGLARTCLEILVHVRRELDLYC